MHYLSRTARKSVDPSLRLDSLAGIHNATPSNVRFDGPVRRSLFTWARYSDRTLPSGDAAGNHCSRAHALAAPIGQSHVWGVELAPSLSGQLDAPNPHQMATPGSDAGNHCRAA